MTPDEMAGYNLFNGKGNCNSCHLDGRGHNADSSDQTDSSATAMVRPLFTCFGSANLGLPLNPRDAFYYQTTPDFFGFTRNPSGFGYRDLGLGTFSEKRFRLRRPTRTSLDTICAALDGQMQVSTARDVASCRPSAPPPKPRGPTSRKSSFTMATSRA